MFSLSDTSRKIIKVMVSISLIALGVGIIVASIFFKGQVFSYSKGLVFGTIFAVLKLILLERSLSKSVDMNRAKAQNYVRLHYTLRYFLTGAVLAVAALQGFACLIGVIIGLVALRPAVYIVNSMYNKQDKNRELS